MSLQVLYRRLIAGKRCQRWRNADGGCLTCGVILRLKYWLYKFKLLEVKSYHTIAEFTRLSSWTHKALRSK
ncbi:hypothetical protein Hanom_Chr16g01505991 [Helianthus anomalus]